jgi:hypothetical protein
MCSKCKLVTPKCSLAHLNRLFILNRIRQLFPHPRVQDIAVSASSCCLMFEWSKPTVLCSGLSMDGDVIYFICDRLLILPARCCTSKISSSASSGSLLANTKIFQARYSECDACTTLRQVIRVSSSGFTSSNAIAAASCYCTLSFWVHVVGFPSLADAVLTWVYAIHGHLQTTRQDLKGF